MKHVFNIFSNKIHTQMHALLEQETRLPNAPIDMWGMPLLSLIANHWKGSQLNRPSFILYNCQIMSRFAWLIEWFYSDYLCDMRVQMGRGHCRIRFTNRFAVGFNAAPLINTFGKLAFEMLDICDVSEWAGNRISWKPRFAQIDADLCTDRPL